MLYMLGGAGVQNFGDEMMVKNWLDFYKESNLLSEVVVDGSNANFLKDFFSHSYINAEFVSVFNELKELGENDFWKSLRRGLNFYKNGGLKNYKQYNSFSSKIKNAKVMHLHGGGYLNTIWPKSAFLLGVAAATKLEFGCKLVATGIGLLPLSKPPAEFLKDWETVVKSFDIFETRDLESNEFIQRSVKSPSNVFFGLDDTFLDSVNLSDQSFGRSLHFSYFNSAKPAINELVAELSEKFLSGFENFYFWQCRGEDNICLDVIKKRIPEIIPISLSDLVFKALPIKKNDYMITSRFHPHMFAARAGVVGLCRFDGGYYDVKQGSIVSLGSPFEQLENASSASIDYLKRPFDRIVDLDDERVAMKRKMAFNIVNLYNNFNKF